MGLTRGKKDKISPNLTNQGCAYCIGIGHYAMAKYLVYIGFYLAISQSMYCPGACSHRATSFSRCSLSPTPTRLVISRSSF